MRTKREVNTAWYDKNAKEYNFSSSEIDMIAFYREFLPKIDGNILDVGCGPGRDAKHFHKLGFNVTAIDPSKSMIGLVSSISAIETHVMNAQGLNWIDRFDGVWSSASLLHVPRDEMKPTLRKIHRAMKTGGVFFCSFKLRDEEWEEGERYFNGYSKKSFHDLIESVGGFKIQKLWETNDIGGRDIVWLNSISLKVEATI
jgi:SAM-dependent methyltransferase